MKLIRLIALVVVIAVAVIAVTAYAVLTTYYPGLYFQAAALPCPSGAITSSPQTHFTIIVSNQGFNGSRNANSCPLMTVAKGQSVTIHVVNNDGETHGFAIAHYLDSGIKLGPGESKDVTFTADQTGSFVVYCNIGCFVHNWQQKGSLNVA